MSAAPAPTADGYYWQIGNLAPDQEFDIALVTQNNGQPAGAVATDEACLSADNGADACANEGGSPAVLGAATGPVAAALAPAAGQELGAWEWTPADQMTPAQMQTAVSDAAENHFNAIYLTVDDELTATDVQTYEQAVGEFLSLAAAQGIRVDAESGWRDWGEPQNQSKAYQIMSFVAAYNASHAIKFRGVQYDIEPYLLPQYDSDEADVLTQYVQLIDGLVAADKQYLLPLTIDVPDFYDSASDAADNGGWRDHFHLQPDTAASE